ncbi:MAG: undecaprenyl-phosphate galactose phosphotransferase WbaP [Desulfovibrio sp.]|jgi:Undecaprenyl-phosphate galactose phosphotransferase WbaP|nr:undecaprenyl-phosphate galactose phosphotransferase WbaP [Desulfovibrio sp.]
MSFFLPPLRSTGFALVVSDFFALLAAMWLSSLLRMLGGGYLPTMEYLGLLPVAPVFLLLYAVLGLYPGVLLAPSDELRRLSMGTSIGFLFLGFTFFLGQHGVLFSRFVILAGWIVTLALVPLCRYATRRIFSSKAWWGYPVIVIAPPGMDNATLARLFSRTESGLVYRAGLPLPEDGDIHGNEAFLRRIDDVSKAHPNAVAYVIADTLPPHALQPFVLQVCVHFKHILIHLDAPWLNQATLRVADFPFGPALTMRQNLVDPRRMLLKRWLDILLCLACAGLCVILVPLIAACIRLDSRGPVFYCHKRIGRHGIPFSVYKFRTMADNAQEVLAETLARDPALRDEWKKTQKLVRDPRLTRVGTFLRHTSLDELPQLYNVLRGEMSFVGPRPIVEKEIARYGEAFDFYKRVRPGITGLWQVSGRNDLSYPQRVELDRYYVYNWSVWLDIYIIIRTIPTVISGKGAY